MKISDAITGTIMQKTGIIPCLVCSYQIVMFRWYYVDRYTDKCVYMVIDGYRRYYKVVFFLHRNALNEIIGFKAIYAEVMR